MDKVKANRTRPAEIEGEQIKIRVYSGPELKKMIKKITGSSDTVVASILAKQFLDESGKEVFTPEWLLTDECPQCFFVELSELFMKVNSGLGKKN